jgi:hypothetical protein
MKEREIKFALIDQQISKKECKKSVIPLNRGFLIGMDALDMLFPSSV